LRRDEAVRRNDQAGLLGALAGILLAITGWTGYRSVDHLFDLFAEIFGIGRNPILRIVAAVFIGIASLGGLSVLFGAFLIWRDRVRFGRMFILLGSGAGFFTLLVFLLVNFRREEFSFIASVLPTVLGVAVGVAARFRSQAKPLLEPFRRS
jgi:hypothetical protein